MINSFWTITASLLKFMVEMVMILSKLDNSTIVPVTSKLISAFQNRFLLFLLQLATLGILLYLLIIY